MLILGSVLKITKEAQNFGQLFSQVKKVVNLGTN
jgi:hypothetical protein